LESEAKLFVQKEILQGTFELIWSYMLDYENAQNPYEERRRAIARWRAIAKSDIGFSESVNSTGNLIMQKALKNKDALHIACALQANCDYFLTTDKGVLNKQIDGIIIINPIDFVRTLDA
jgi:predicted nucleic acid-binding protein